MREVPARVLALLEHALTDEHGSIRAACVNAKVGVDVREAAHAAAQPFAPKALLEELFAAAADAGAPPSCINILGLVSDLWEGSSARADAPEHWRRLTGLVWRLRRLTTFSHVELAASEPSEAAIKAVPDSVQCLLAAPGALAAAVATAKVAAGLFYISHLHAMEQGVEVRDALTDAETRRRLLRTNFLLQHMANSMGASQLQSQERQDAIDPNDGWMEGLLHNLRLLLSPHRMMNIGSRFYELDPSDAPAVIADVIVSEMVVPALTAAGSGTKAQTDPPASHKQKAVLAPFFVWQDRSGTTLSRSLCWALRLDAAAAVFTHCDPEEHVFSIQVENAMESALAASPPKDTINVLGAMPLDVPGMNQSARKMKVRGNSVQIWPERDPAWPARVPLEQMQAMGGHMM